MHTINSVLAKGGSEESAFKQAWGAIKRSYHKVGEEWKELSELKNGELIIFHNETHELFDSARELFELHNNIVKELLHRNLKHQVRQGEDLDRVEFNFSLRVEKYFPTLPFKSTLPIKINSLEELND